MTDQNEKQQDPAPTKTEPEFPMLDGMGEAGGQAFTVVRHEVDLGDGKRKVMEVNLTARGRNVREALRNLGDGLRFAEEKGMTPYRVFADAPAKVQGATPPPPKTPTNGTPPPAKTGTPPAQTPSEPVNGTIHIKKMGVTPKPDGKVYLEFFDDQPNHKFAAITKSCTVEVAIQTLREVGGFGAEHFASAVMYEIDANIQWANSTKMNTHGKPYRDILSVTPA